MILCLLNDNIISSSKANERNEADLFAILLIINEKDFDSNI